ncbi:MAG: hypothetical protein H7Y04_07280 [Verrucomicrobia bacterium]|nr:hypothetical protein [Cytophagales bacterium]
MKKLPFIIAVTGLLIMGISCKESFSTSQYISDRYAKSATTMRYDDRNTFFEINYTGAISFNEDETAIQISPNGYVRYEENNKKLFAESNAEGKISYEMYENGSKLNFDDTGKKFLAEIIKKIIHHGVDADNRLLRVYKKGGNRAVLNEIAHLKGDNLKSKYLQYLLIKDTLTPTEITEVVMKTDSLIESDFEKGKLLGNFATHYLKNEPSDTIYFESVQKIHSDFEKGNIIKKILKQPLANKQMVQLLKVTKSIESDFEKTNVLKSMISKEAFEEEVFIKLLEVINQLDSDFEKANLLKSIATKATKTEQQWLLLMNETAKIASDFEKSNVLVQVARKMPKNEKIKAAYMKVAKTLASDSEYSKVVRVIE